MSGFANLMASIARELVWDESFFETFEALGVSGFDWPEDALQTRVVEKYLKLRRENGHAYAQHCLMQEAEKLEILKMADMPVELEVLKPLYEQALLVHRAESLAQAISRKPREVEQLISNYQRRTTTSVMLSTLQKCIGDYLPQRLEKIQSGEPHVVLSNFELLSHAIGGFNPGRLGILLADTGFGKTNLGLQLALSSADKKPTLYFNMEMIPYDFTERAVVAMTGVGYSDIYKPGALDLATVEYRASRKQLEITDGRDLSTEQIKSTIRAESARRSLGLVVIDYDQKLILKTDKNTPEWKALQSAIIELEGIAKECKTYILVLAQTNDEGNISSSRRATFSASTVLRFFLDDKTNPSQPMPVIQAVKNRFGARGSAVSIDYDPGRARVREIGKTIVATSRARKEFPE